MPGLNITYQLRLTQVNRNQYPWVYRLSRVFRSSFASTMPREIVTVQLGQCGNQSTSLSNLINMHV